MPPGHFPLLPAGVHDVVDVVEVGGRVVEVVDVGGRVVGGAVVIGATVVGGAVAGTTVEVTVGGVRIAAASEAGVGGRGAPAALPVDPDRTVVGVTSVGGAPPPNGGSASSATGSGE